MTKRKRKIPFKTKGQRASIKAKEIYSVSFFDRNIKFYATNSDPVACWQLCKTGSEWLVSESFLYMHPVPSHPGGTWHPALPREPSQSQILWQGSWGKPLPRYSHQYPEICDVRANWIAASERVSSFHVYSVPDTSGVIQSRALPNVTCSLPDTFRVTHGLFLCTPLTPLLSLSLSIAFLFPECLVMKYLTEKCRPFVFSFLHFQLDRAWLQVFHICTEK